MWIKVTHDFIDTTDPDPDKEPVAAGRTLNVTAERGAELIAAGVAVANADDADSEPASTAAPDTSDPSTPDAA